MAITAGAIEMARDQGRDVMLTPLVVGMMLNSENRTQRSIPKRSPPRLLGSRSGNLYALIFPADALYRSRSKIDLL